MAWSNGEIRKLLRALRNGRLDARPLAKELQRALQTSDPRGAVLSLIERSFDRRDHVSECLYDSIALCDIRGMKARTAAAAMNVSVRQLFRYRAQAVDSLAAAVDKVVNEVSGPTKSRLALAGMVGRFDPAAALKLYEATVPEPDGKLAFEMLTTAIRAGKPITKKLLRRCTGHWRLLAMAALGRRFLVNGEPNRLKPWREKAQLLLSDVAGPGYDRAAYELAYLDRLEAVRYCDMNGAREAAQRMGRFAGKSDALNGLAMVVQAEQACDDGDEALAAATLERLERLNACALDFRVMARTAHAQAVLALMRDQYDDALDLSHAAAAALVQVEPGFALCAHANEGRAALQANRPWEFPASLCAQYRSVWITGHLYSVRARHLLESDRDGACEMVDRAMSIAESQSAAGALMYARATRGMVHFAMGCRSEALHDWIEAWEQALTLGRASYFGDLFVHPALGDQPALAMLQEPVFVSTIIRRLGKHLALGEQPSRTSRCGVFTQAIRRSLQSAARSIQDDGMGLNHATSLRSSVASPVLAIDAEPVSADAPPHPEGRLAREVALILTPPRRARFCAEFETKLAQVLKLSAVAEPAGLPRSQAS